ncbi:hypothetical protein [Chitinophaga alhagiae]|uniref:hypothetical protein n=1 Tax=Chitinophaga alhagiae TaxID=2203219 RepID=UPI000E5C416E|nr:hypothetical protein [Chitinophaga alhagiae]
MKKKKNELKTLSQYFTALETTFRKRVCKELAWRKATFHERQKSPAKLSPVERDAIKGIGWELANDLRRKISK